MRSQVLSKIEPPPNKTSRTSQLGLAAELRMHLISSLIEFIRISLVILQKFVKSSSSLNKEMHKVLTLENCA